MNKTIKRLNIEEMAVGDRGWIEFQDDKTGAPMIAEVELTEIVESEPFFCNRINANCEKTSKCVSKRTIKRLDTGEIYTDDLRAENRYGGWTIYETKDDYFLTLERWAEIALKGGRDKHDKIMANLKRLRGAK